MQTFSIAAGEYDGFSFRVNPVNTALVEFSHVGPAIAGDASEGDHNIVATFQRNGALVSVTRLPVNSTTHVVKRDAVTGAPAVVPLPLTPEQQKLADAKVKDDARIADEKARSDAATAKANSEVVDDRSNYAGMYGSNQKPSDQSSKAPDYNPNYPETGKNAAAPV